MKQIQLSDTIIDTEEMQVTDIPIGENREETLSAGDGIFINAGILHMAKPLPGQNGIYICVMADASLLKGFPASVFDARYVTPFLSSGDFDSVVFHMDTPWQAYILRLITDISNLRYMSHYAYELDVQSNLYRIWSLLLKNLRPSENGSKKKSHSEMALNAMITYIGEHYTERIRIEDLAKTVSYSPGECCRIFRKRLGVTVSQYITAYRVERSTALLSDPALSIADIAYACGFCGTSYYIRHFKALTGKTPLQYRRSGA